MSKSIENQMERTAVVLAAGGERVIPWEMGVLAGLAESGEDPREAKLLVGTSAGSLVGARIASGIDPIEEAARISADGVPEIPQELAAMAEAALPALLELQRASATLGRAELTRRAGQLALTAETIPEELFIAATEFRLQLDRWPDALKVATLDARTGERVTLSAADGLPLANGVAASRALPGMLPPITVGERSLTDAIPVSGTNAEIAAVEGVERVVVVTAAPEEAPAGTVDAALEAGLPAELEALRAAGKEVWVIRADDAARRVMGDVFYACSEAAAAVEAGREAGRRAGSEMGAQADHDRAVATAG